MAYFNDTSFTKIFKEGIANLKVTGHFICKEFIQANDIEISEITFIGSFSTAFGENWENIQNREIILNLKMTYIYLCRNYSCWWREEDSSAWTHSPRPDGCSDPWEKSPCATVPHVSFGWTEDWHSQAGRNQRVPNNDFWNSVPRGPYMPLCSKEKPSLLLWAVPEQETILQKI